MSCKNAALEYTNGIQNSTLKTDNFVQTATTKLRNNQLSLPQPRYFFSSSEPKAHGELIVYQSSRHPSVRPSVRASTHLNINISVTSGPIATKFYLKHHWGGEKAALGFQQNRIGTLVSMATDSSHWVIMGKILLAL